jgi:hypothetical protein
MPAKAKIVTQGKIWANRTTREVLYSILKHKKVAVGVLRITGTKPIVEGEICICNGIFVVGGQLKNGSAKGYGAIRPLLMQHEGAFQYFEMDEDVPYLDQGLKLRLTQLINSLPNLPNKYDDLVGASTYNRIRAVDIDDVPSEEKLIEKDTTAQLAAWEQRSLKLRAAALWGTFAVVSVVVCLLYFFQH